MNESKVRVIDLTHPVHEGMTVFPVHWHPKVEITQMGRHEVERRETRKFTMGTHTGTHVDAPSHFLPGGKSIDQMPLATFVGPAMLADLSFAQPLQEIQLAELKSAIGIKNADRLLLRFGWSKMWGTPDFYPKQPYLSDECAHWIVDQGFILLGMDTPQADNPKNGRGCDRDSPLHKIFLARDIVQLEYLRNLDQIREKKVFLSAAPLNILGGDGAPCRAIAVEGILHD